MIRLLVSPRVPHSCQSLLSGCRVQSRRMPIAQRRNAAKLLWGRVKLAVTWGCGDMGTEPLGRSGSTLHDLPG